LGARFGALGVLFERQDARKAFKKLPFFAKKTPARAKNDARDRPASES
jgi:hypothetical protein